MEVQEGRKGQGEAHSLFVHQESWERSKEDEDGGIG
jgi:hypothetical protein